MYRSKQWLIWKGTTSNKYNDDKEEKENEQWVRTTRLEKENYEQQKMTMTTKTTFKTSIGLPISIHTVPWIISFLS